MNQRYFSKIILFVVILICLLSAANIKAFSLDTYTRNYLKFYILESEFNENKYIEGDMYELGFTEYNNYKTPFTRPIDDRMLTFRSVFSIDSSCSNEELYLVVLPIDYACKLYLNGELINIRGDFKRKYTNRLHYSEKILLSSNKLKYNALNEIAIQAYPREGETYPLGQVFITNSFDASNYVFYRNLLGTKLLAALSLSGFVFFLFYLITYISRREYQKQQFLYFAFMNLFFVVSYSNNIFTNDYANIYLVEKIARVGFPLFIFVGLCFLLDYTGLFRRKGLIKLALIVIYLPAIIMVLKPNTTTEVIKTYNSYPLISLFVGNFMLFILVLLFYLRERNAKSFFLLLIFSINIIAGLYDGYYFAVLKVKPFMLLTPVTVFGINIIIFFVLAVDHSKLYHLALSSSKKLEILNQELEIKVEKRTKEIKEYTKMLEEANKTKDKFFSIIAHDLKNPFNTLIGYSDVLKSDFREYGQDEIYQHLTTIYNTSVNGYNLLENLLKWSQSQTNKIRFEPNKVNLFDLVKVCIEDSENQSNFKDIELINEVSRNYHIIADKNLLKTVLRNLINNAIKFTERNGMIIISSLKTENAVEFCVKDTGVGMKEEEIKNLFKIDKINSKPGTDREKGSGLGLILCKEFVEIHGGKIWAESTLGGGSEFKFSIPKMVTIN